MASTAGKAWITSPIEPGLISKIDALLTALTKDSVRGNYPQSALRLCGPAAASRPEQGCAIARAVKPRELSSPRVESVTFSFLKMGIPLAKDSVRGGLSAVCAAALRASRRFAAGTRMRDRAGSQTPGALIPPRGVCHVFFSQNGHSVGERFGEGGIRTPGSLLDYGALAKRCFRPLSHLTLEIKTSSASLTQTLVFLNSFRCSHPARFPPSITQAAEHRHESRCQRLRLLH